MARTRFSNPLKSILTLTLFGVGADFAFACSSVGVFDCVGEGVACASDCGVGDAAGPGALCGFAPFEGGCCAGFGGEVSGCSFVFVRSSSLVGKKSAGPSAASMPT